MSSAALEMATAELNGFCDFNDCTGRCAVVVDDGHFIVALCAEHAVAEGFAQ